MSFVSDIEKYTAEMFTTILERSVVMNGTQVKAFTYELIGTGKMGDNVRIHLEYSSECDAPATIVAKLPAKDQTSREMAGMMGAYRIETRFYQELAGASQSHLPSIYEAQVSDDGTDFIILMEDLAPAVPGDQLIGESFERAKAAMTQAAQLHASFYGKDEVLEKDYVMRAEQGAVEFGQELLQQNWPGFVERFGKDLSEECIQFGDKYVNNYAKWAMGFKGTKTLAHGDFRSENILFDDAKGTATAIDWQTINYTSGLADVAYFIGGSLTIDDRKQYESKLLDFYRAEINTLGIELSEEDCYQQYREFALHGLMINILGAMFSGADERGDKMFTIMAQRHLQQCVDLNSQEFL